MQFRSLVTGWRTTHTEPPSGGVPRNVLGRYVGFGRTSLVRKTYVSANLDIDVLISSSQKRYMLLRQRAFHISVDRRLASCFSTMKFSSFALAAAVFASVANGFAGPQVTPRFALSVSARSLALRIRQVLL